MTKEEKKESEEDVKKVEADVNIQTHSPEEELIMHEAIKVVDGVHEGQIVDVKHETRKEYNYIDIYVETDDEKGETVKIKTGFPGYLSENSGLGQLLLDSGMELKVQDTKTIKEIQEHLIGKKVQFQTFTEDKFARIINKTIKFL